MELHADTLTSIFAGAFGVALALAGAWFGGRRWRENFEAERAARQLADEAHAATREELAAERVKAARLEEENRGQSSRLARLDETIQEMGGKRVVEAIGELADTSVGAFRELTKTLEHSEARQVEALERLIEAHDRRAEARAEKVAGLLGGIAERLDHEHEPEERR